MLCRLALMHGLDSQHKGSLTVPLRGTLNRCFLSRSLHLSINIIIIGRVWNGLKKMLCLLKAPCVRLLNDTIRTHSDLRFKPQSGIHFTKELIQYMSRKRGNSPHFTVNGSRNCRLFFLYIKQTILSGMSSTSHEYTILMGLYRKAELQFH